VNRIFHRQKTQKFWGKSGIRKPCRLAALILIAVCAAAGGKQPALAALAELTEAQAIARARAILNRNKSACRIGTIHSISAARVKAGWRVTARITMSASGSPQGERAVWIISAKNGASPSNQLTAEIGMGCP
jgi:hypothetical protein